MFNNFSKKADPVKVGNILAKRFFSRPLSLFGAFRNETVPYVTYPDTCAWYGVFNFAILTNNDELFEQGKNKYDELIENRPNLVPVANHVDNSVFGIVPLQIYIKCHEKRYLDSGLYPADEQFKVLSPEEYSELSLENRDYYSKGYSWQTRFWLDDMFMMTALQTTAYKATGDSLYLDRTAREMLAYLDKLQTDNGLFYHADDVPIYWGRGDGWLAAGMAELLNVLPKDNIYYKDILSGYKKMMATLLKYQDGDGMWHQLVDDKDSWPETSATAMFTFAFITGVKNGWLDEKIYYKPTYKAWETLCNSYINDNGDVTDICEGTCKLNDIQYYQDRERITGDIHGQAPMIWCVNALLR